MPLALTGQEWGFLLVAVGPAILTVVVIYFVWRWAKRDEAREQAERAAASSARGESEDDSQA